MSAPCKIRIQVSEFCFHVLLNSAGHNDLIFVTTYITYGKNQGKRETEHETQTR